MALLIAPVLLATVPDIGTGQAVPSYEEGWQPIWESEVVYECGALHATDGVAVGEVYTEKKGLETVFVSRDNGLYVSYHEGGAWKTDKLWTSPGNQLTPVIGDLRPDLPGNEILVVGLSSGSEDVDPGDGTATVLHLSGSQWVAETVHTEKDLIHGADIGDLDPTVPGVEAVVTSFGHRVTHIYYDTGSKTWKNSTIYQDGGSIKKCVIADLLSDRPGLEVASVGSGGNLTIGYGNHTKWNHTTIYSGDPAARIAVGNLDPDPNLEIYIGTDTFKVIGFKRSGSTWTNMTVFMDTGKNRGVWVADVDPTIDGAELYSYGYSTRLVQLSGTFSSAWKANELFKDVARGHEIRIGDIMSDLPGQEIALVGYSNNLTVVHLSSWEYSVAFEGTPNKATDGLDIGEVYPDKPGLETVFTSRDGWVYLSFMEDGVWKNEKLWSSPGQQLTPAIGDLRPDLPGNEILVVGLSSGTENVDPGDGTATVLHRSESQWYGDTVYTDPNLIHGCAIGDVDPNIPGNEAVITTFSKRAILIWYDQTSDAWNSSIMFQDGGNVRKAVIADVLPERPGLEVLAVSNVGNCTLVYGTHVNANWTYSRIYMGDPLARVTVGNLDPDENLEVYLGTDTFKVIGLKRSGSTWTSHTIFTDTDKNRGVWTGDVDPSIPGPELYSFSYSTRVVQITGDFSSGWRTKDIFRDTARSHDIRIGDVRPSTPGPEIALVGYSNNLTILSPRVGSTPVSPTIEGKTTDTLNSGETKRIDLTISGNSFARIEVSTSSTDIIISASPLYIPYYGKVGITVTAKPTNVDSNARIDVKVTSEGVSTWHNITVTVKGDKVAPTIPQITNSTGTPLLPNATISADEVLHISLSKLVTRSSFEAALTEGKLKVEWGKQKRDADFNLSDDGRTISVDLKGLAPIGTVTVTVGGLKDEAGNTVETRTFDFKVKADEEEPDDRDLVILIIMALVIIAVLAVLIFLIYGGKTPVKEEEGTEESGEGEEDADKEDKGSEE